MKGDKKEKKVKKENKDKTEKKHKKEKTDKKDKIEKKEEAEDREKDFVVGHALTNITAGTHSKSMAIMTVLVNSCQDRKMVSCVADILSEDDNMKLGDLRQQLQLK